MARYFDIGGIARLSVGRIIFVAVSGVVTNAPAAAAAATVWGRASRPTARETCWPGLVWCTKTPDANLSTVLPAF